MNKLFFGLGLTMVLNFTLAAQTHKRPPEPDDRESAKPTKQRSAPKSGKSTPQSDSLATISNVTDVHARLQNTLDARHAKVGDEVILKTIQPIKQNGETIVPKGSTLVGRITEVTARQSNKGNSRLGIVFDRLEGKDISTAIDASIVSMTNEAATAPVPDAFEPAMAPTSPSSSGSRGSGGGLLGSGGAGGLLGGAGNSAGGLLNTATSTVGTVTNPVLGTATGAAGTVGSTINGIQITNSLSGSAVLSSGNKNVRVEKGTTFHLNIAKPANSQE